MVDELDVDTAAAVVEDLDVQIGAQVIEKLDTQKAAEIVEGIDPSKAADIIEAIETSKAAEIIETVNVSQAADIIEAVDASNAADIITVVETAKAAEIVEGVGTETATAIVERVETKRAAEIIELVETAKAARIVTDVATTEASDVLSQVAPVKAGQIMEVVPTAKLTQVVQTMEENKLVERLPEMSAAKLFQVPTTVLFEELPRVPVEQLALEVPPQADPGLPPPTSAQVSADVTLHTLPETAELAWSTLVGSQAPIEKILARFTRKLAGVEARLEGLAEEPPGTPALDPGQAVYSLFRVDIANAGPQDISVAHVTLFVEKSWLEANGVHKWSIQLRRLDEETGAWVSFPSKRVRDDDRDIYYTAVVPGFSLIAVTGSSGLPEQVFGVHDLAIEPSSPDADQDVVISAQVTNTGQTAAVYPAALWINDTIEAAQPITVAAGETKRVEFTLRKPEGAYRIRVERLLGDLLVGVAPTPTPAPTGTPRPPPSPAPTSPPSPTASPKPTVALPSTPPPAPAVAALPAASPTPTPAREGGLVRGRHCWNNVCGLGGPVRRRVRDIHALTTKASPTTFD